MSYLWKRNVNFNIVFENFVKLIFSFYIFRHLRKNKPFKTTLVSNMPTTTMKKLSSRTSLWMFWMMMMKMWICLLRCQMMNSIQTLPEILMKIKIRLAMSLKRTVLKTMVLMTKIQMNLVKTMPVIIRN